MRFLRTLVAVGGPALLLLLACGDGDGEGSSSAEATSMDELNMAFDDERTHLLELVEDHDGLVNAVADLDELAETEAEYLADARHHHEDMEHGLGDLQDCGDEHTQEPLDEIELLLRDLGMELATHQENIEAAEALDGALEEEMRHQEMMTDLLDALGEEQVHLGAGTDGHMCTHGVPDEHHDDMGMMH